MSLNTKLQERSYLFGRLLAIADKAESQTYEKVDKGRMTNAKRYWSVFSKRPAKTWAIIQESLIPYLMKLGIGERKKYEALISQIIDQFMEGGFSNEPLSENYLLGYACQMEELKPKGTSNQEDTNSKGEKEDV